MSRFKQLIVENGPVFGIYEVLSRGCRKVFCALCTLVWRARFRSCDRGLRVDYGVMIDQPKNIEIGVNCKILSGVKLTSEFGDSLLRLANNVQLNNGVHIDFSGGVVVGNNSLVSEKTVIYSHDHGYDPHSVPVKKSLKIGKGVWIGANVMIMASVEYIADNSVVAAGSVVTKNVEAWSVVGGNPARVLKSLI